MKASGRLGRALHKTGPAAGAVAAGGIAGSATAAELLQELAHVAAADGALRRQTILTKQKNRT